MFERTSFGIELKEQVLICRTFAFDNHVWIKVVFGDRNSSVCGVLECSSFIIIKQKCGYQDLNLGWKSVLEGKEKPCSIHYKGLL